MKVKQYQTGGIVYTPFIREAPASRQTTQSSSNNNENNIQKAIISLLDENGLPNDVDYFLNRANRLLSSYTTGENQDYSMSDLIQLHSLANKIKHNSDSYNAAKERMENENSGSEVAITNTGALYVQDENGQLKTISANTYYEHSDKYTILTQTDLMNFREHSPDLTYNSTILNDLNSSIGMGSIVSHLTNMINAFGTNTMDDKSNRLTVKDRGVIEQGMDNILGGASPDGVYNITTRASSSDQGYVSGDLEGLYEAASYLWTTLNPQMKNTLKAHTAAEGLNPNKIEDVYRILVSAIQRHTDHTRSYHVDVDYNSSASKTGGGNSGNSEQMTQLTYLEQVATGRVTADQWVDLRSNTGISNIRFIGNPYPVLDYGDKPVQTESITNMLLDAQIGQIVDQSSVSFGNRVLGIHEKSQVLYDSSSPMYRVNLPYDVAYFNNTGKYKPDLEAQEKFDEFIKWINNNNPSQIMITQKLQELGLNISYDSDRREWVFNNNKEFIMCTGVSSHRAVNIDNKWKGRLSNQEASYLYDYLDEHTEFDEALWNIWGDSDSTYKSAIFIPIIDSALATVGTSGEYIPKSYKMDIQNRTRYNNTITNIPTNF